MAKKKAKPTKKVTRRPKVRKTDASELVTLLRDRHDEDVYCTEISVGSPRFDAGIGSVRFDFWAMRCSWSKATYHGYEIKVSRSDFTGDEKWHRYLPGTTHFSFVCPWGLIDPNELPSDVGLICLSQNGERLVTRRKPRFRPVTDENRPVVFNMIKSALMRNRSDVTDSEARKIWAQNDRGLDDVGHLIRSKVAGQLVRRKLELDREAKAIDSCRKTMKRDAEIIEQIKDELERLTGQRRLPSYFGDAESNHEELRARVEAHEKRFSRSQSIAELHGQLTTSVTSMSVTIEHFRKMLSDLETFKNGQDSKTETVSVLETVVTDGHQLPKRLQ